MLFFNFYILELGFNRQYLGLVNSVSSMATLIFGIPMGILSDRIGQKRAMLLGVGIQILGSILELNLIDPIFLLCMAFLNGTGRMIFLLNVAPFLTKASKPEDRTFLFSLNFGLVILAGVFGNFFSSRLAVWFAAALQVSMTSAKVYRSTLMFAISLGFLALILLALIREPKSGYFDHRTPLKEANQPGKNLAASLKSVIHHPIIRRLALVQLVFGLGVALLTPYMNLFFDEKFQISPQTLGDIFSMKALFTGAAAMLVPRLAQSSGSRIKIAVFSQFLGGISWLVLGFSPNFSLAVSGFLLGGVFLNTPVPLMEAFSMDQVQERQRATLVSIRELSWQAGWGGGPYLSGSIQEHFGFSPIFMLSIATMWLTAVMNHLFFRNIEKGPGCPLFH